MVSFDLGRFAGLFIAVAVLAQGCPTDQPGPGDDDDAVASDTLAPVVAIVAPASGALLSGSVTVQVEANDDVGVASVSLSIDGTALAAVTTAPYEFAWDTSSEINGSHVIEAVAADAAGNESDTFIVVEVDNGGLPAGAVNLTNPVDGATVCGTITVTASAVPEIIEVAFSVDALPIGTDAESPFEATWNTSSFAAGPHVVTAVGSDIEGNLAQASASVDVEGSASDCDNLPTVAITAPEPDAFVEGTLAVTATASDDKGVRRVEFFLDGGMFFNDEMIPYGADLDTTLFEEGPHGLRAVAYDTADQTAQHEITINIDRTPPEVSFDSPSSSAVVNGTFDVVVSATDNVGVSEVELWVGGSPQGAVPSPPYSWSVDADSFPSGSLLLEATATDGAGLTGNSSRTVQIDQLPEVSITAPSGTVTEASVEITVDASDDLGVASVEFRVDGDLIDTLYSQPWETSFDACALGNGSSQIEVTIEDTGGQTATDTANITVSVADADGDGYTVCDDCSDSQADVYPGAPELCDATDNDCDGQFNEGFDADGDGWGTCAVEVIDVDCDDSEPTVYPSAPFLCDGLDNDCEAPVDPNEADADGDGLSECDGDCDDGDPQSPLASPEVCDGLDNDCDGVLPTEEVDADADGMSECEGDCDDADPLRFSGNAEVCDGVDNDCNVATEAAGGEADQDADGTPGCGDCDDYDAVSTVIADDADCDGSLSVDDCDDGDDQAAPSLPEVCGDSIDNNCDGGASGCGLMTGVWSLSIADGVFNGVGGGDRAGDACAVLPDANGDGVNELLVGAPRSDVGGTDSGSVYVVLGPPLGVVGLQSSYRIVHGEQVGSEAGSAVAGVDLDGDGYGELVVGAPFVTPPSTRVRSTSLRGQSRRAKPPCQPVRRPSSALGRTTEMVPV